MDTPTVERLIRDHLADLVVDPARSAAEWAPLISPRSPSKVVEWMAQQLDLAHVAARHAVDGQPPDRPQLRDAMASARAAYGG